MSKPDTPVISIPNRSFQVTGQRDRYQPALVMWTIIHKRTGLRCITTAPPEAKPLLSKLAARLLHLKSRSE